MFVTRQQKVIYYNMAYNAVFKMLLLLQRPNISQPTFGEIHHKSYIRTAILKSVQSDLTFYCLLP